MVEFNNSWDDILKDEFEKEYYKRIRRFLAKEYRNPNHHIYPDMYDIFNAMKITDYNDVKAVILGQDPYHGPGQAHGLSFSVKKGIQPPPSLINIFKEYHNDLGYPIPESGELTRWAENGVLLLNTVLTVQGGLAASHKGIGWEIFTDNIISLLNNREKPIVFILWGRFARDKKRLLTNPNHYIIESAHPSPLSAYNGFFGSKPFSKANSYLKDDPIDWRLD